MDIKDMNVNSNNNQTIKGKFVGREVITCVTSTTEYILNQNDYNAPFSWDDVENYFIDNSDEIEEIEDELLDISEKRRELEDKVFSLENKNQLTYEKERELDEKINEFIAKEDELQEKIDELEQEQDEPQEVYEWWEVSSYLLEKLRAKGEVVIPHMNIWGRCRSGQAILLDYVISEICFDNEILEGQENYKYWID